MIMVDNDLSKNNWKFNFLFWKGYSTDKKHLTFNIPLRETICSCYMYEDQLKSSQADQDNLKECDQMGFML